MTVPEGFRVQLAAGEPFIRPGEDERPGEAEEHRVAEDDEGADRFAVGNREAETQQRRPGQQDCERGFDRFAAHDPGDDDGDRSGGHPDRPIDARVSGEKECRADG